jgi:hypothetical protein
MLASENPLQYKDMLQLPIGIVIFNAEQRIKSMTAEMKAVAKHSGNRSKM